MNQGHPPPLTARERMVDAAVRLTLADGLSRVWFQEIFGQERLFESPAIIPHFADRVRTHFSRMAGVAI